MATVSSFDEERAEISAVLQSGIFLRAPNLESFFRYICERTLLGEAEQLKEYSVAVEALGRAPHFDPKKDSIVRVEAHRLRKRLSQYYAGSGAGHKVQITVPRGSYAPQFVYNDSEVAGGESAAAPAAVPAAVELSQIALESPPVPIHSRFPPDPAPRTFKWLWGSVPAALIFAVLIWRLVSGTGAAAYTEKWKTVPQEIVPAEFRMIAGYHGVPFTDAQEREWHSDAFYSGGRSIALSNPNIIQGLPASTILRSARTGSFRYDIPVREGVYEVHLYFAETEFGSGNPKGGGDGSRLFHLSINENRTIDLFDVHTQAGGANRVFVRVFKDISRSTDGKIHIVFDPVSSMAFVNAIEILPTAAGRIRPVRIVAQDHSVTDSDGQVWSADEYVVGGTMVLRHETNFQDRNTVLYQGERYGNFSYHIPLAPGKYRLTLHFAETWFGTPSARVDRQEHRLFDVFANGVSLIREFDVLREAGGPNRRIEKVFSDLEPNAQGELTLQFVPLSNYAEVNAIEVVETD